MTWDEVDARLLQETLRVQDKPYRTRGNPSWVLRMVAKVKVKRCCICPVIPGDHQAVELHHEDGNWKNYRLHNLNWYCKQHHQQADNYILHIKENTMTKTMKGGNMSWSIPTQTRFWNEIQVYRNLGLKSTQIFQEISNNSETIFQKHLTMELIRKAAYKFDLLKMEPSKNPKNMPKNMPIATSSVTAQDTITYTEIKNWQRQCAALGKTFVLR